MSGIGWIAVGAADAQAKAPDLATMMQNPLVMAALVGGAILLVLVLIWGILNISRRAEADDDGAGVGVLEGIDDDDKSR
jgi:hypothetical protein